MTLAGDPPVTPALITLAEFLLARFADDEAAARESGADAMVGWRWKHYPPEAYEEVQALTLAHSARVIAECEAKRRIVENICIEAGGIWEDHELGSAILACLSLPYADHPDYREEWRA